MNKNKLEHIEHVTLMDTGDILPVIFRIDEGYRRGGYVKTADGDFVVILAVSNVKAEESTLHYHREENEKVIDIMGLVINKKKDAEVLSEFFHNMAEDMT